MARIVRGGDGALHVSDLPPLLAWGLRELPRILADDAPGIGERLCPDPFPDDSAAGAEWRRLSEPDLAHLFDEARTIVARDLANLRYEKGGFTLRIPAANQTAWLSALAAARVAQASAHGIGEGEMDRPFEPDVRTDRHKALLLIHLLGWFQGFLIEGDDPSAEDLGD